MTSVLRRHVSRRVLRLGAATVTAVVAVTSSLAPGASALTVINGAGSTFDQPFFTLAFYEYQKTVDHNTSVNYASIGSGGGEQQIEQNTVSFGATDVPMMASDLAQATAGPIVQVPVDLGGEAISYNVAGLPNHLHMTGPVLADIYMGKITNWDDNTLGKLNPGVNLPDQPIVVVHRSDGSGTSYAFTNYLADVSPTWKSQVGIGKTVAWPTGIGGKGNEGVAGLIKDTPGAIGYVELNYALVNNFQYMAVQNPMGSYVLPSLASTAAEAALLPNVSASHFVIDDLKGDKSSYPIATYSWAAIYKNQKNAQVGTALVNMLEWLTHPGQKWAGSLQYVPLPASVQALAQSSLLQVVGANGKPLLTQAAIAKYSK
jgi:phosphate transport system substrate-binding protein